MAVRFPVQAIAPTCVVCNVKPAALNQVKNGYLFVDNGPACYMCKNPNKATSGTAKKHRGDVVIARANNESIVCVQCGLIEECVGDTVIDHINGLHYDNRKVNHQVLCLICNNRKTHRSKDNRSTRAKLADMFQNDRAEFDAATQFILANIPSDKLVKGQHTKTYNEYMVVVKIINELLG